MRKKKEQVESPVIPLSTIPLEPTPDFLDVPAGGSDEVANPSEGVKETAEEQGGAPFEQSSRAPVTESSDVIMDRSSSPVHEPEPIKVKPEIPQPPQIKSDGPPESWLFDSQLLRPREGRAPTPSPLPAPPRVPPEKGNSMSPSPAPQSEDGEIPQDPLPRSQPPQLGNSSFPQVITPLRAAPPTQPRSYAWKNNTSPTIPSRSNSLSHLINANPNGSVNGNLNNLSTTFANSPNRPGPPSGPKALRGLNPRVPFDGSRYKPGGTGSGLNGNVMNGLPGMNGNGGMGVGLRRESNPNNGHPAIPKGPSADRERERERANGNWSTKNWGNGWR